MYKIGKITNTHGIKGEVKIFNMSDFNRFSVGKEIYVLQKGEKIYFTIERIRTQKNILIIKFKGYDDINLIEAYKGLELYSDDLVTDELEEDDYHYSDLIDLDVFDLNHQKLGTVKSIIPVPQGHLLEILTIEGKKALVPFNQAFIEDVLKDSIIIKPIEGLL
ncbi:MAG: ribosome maturation factor RimM [Acholeplasmataceae bacterium]|nr:ribosome maturation factor RimM [Acholeplasmataceae bacterium]MDD4194428.1 ribosome maturation factor RimM [Acholeplasmataceae bacterium]